MAKPQLHLAQDNKPITHKDLDCAVKWLNAYTVYNGNLFGMEWVFKYGQPGKFPNGKYGYTLYGDMAVYSRPVPEPGDHRVSYRHNEIPEYTVEYGSLIEIIAPYTNYYHRDYINLENPERVMARHLAGLSDTIPNYMRWLLFKMFAGAKTKAASWNIKEWGETYIEPTNGANEGYKFYFHKGHAEINLSKVLNPVDKKDHPLKTRLEAINTAIRNDTRKVEVDSTKNELITTGGPRTNITPSRRKTLALWDTVCTMAHDILVQGRFDVKYKHNNDDNHWKDYTIPVTNKDQLICVMNRSAWQKLKMEIQLSNPITTFMSESDFPGRFMVSDLVDEDEAFIFQEGLIQAWILPKLSDYSIFPYASEATRDFIYEFAHSIDLVDIYSSVYFKLK